MCKSKLMFVNVIITQRISLFTPQAVLARKTRRRSWNKLPNIRSYFSLVGKEQEWVQNSSLIHQIILKFFP